METSINERIKFVLDTLCGGSISELSRIIGVNQPALRDIVGSKQSKPGYEILNKIVDNSTLNIDADWLLTGRGYYRSENYNTYDEKLVLHYTTANGLIGILKTMTHNFSDPVKSNDIKERRLLQHKELKIVALSEKEDKKDYIRNFKWISFFRKNLKNSNFENERIAIWQPKMFDQFADFHKGACIEYNVAKIFKQNSFLNKSGFVDIVYEPYPKTPKSTVEEELKFKTYSYRDERECRILYNGSEKYINIENCISKIYLGCNFFEDTIKVSEFCRVIEEKDIHPKKIVEIIVKELDYLMPDNIGQIFKDGKMIKK
jgi:transcriptional regulator with XRE-family HTH domain